MPTAAKSEKKNVSSLNNLMLITVGITIGIFADRVLGASGITGAIKASLGSDIVALSVGFICVLLTSTLLNVHKGNKETKQADTNPVDKVVGGNVAEKIATFEHGCSVSDKHSSDNTDIKKSVSLKTFSSQSTQTDHGLFSDTEILLKLKQLAVSTPEIANCANTNNKRESSIADTVKSLEEKSSQPSQSQINTETIEENVETTNLLPIASFVPPPPPPPPTPSLKKVAPEYKHCPIVPIPCSKESIFSSIIIETPEDIVKEVCGSLDEFKQHFGVTSSKPSDRRDSGLEDDTEFGPVLDDRKSKLIDLFVRQTRMQPSQICTSVNYLESSAISVEILKQMLKSCPNDQEVVHLLRASKEKLSSPEQFMQSLIQVPNYLLKLKAMRFITSYQDISKDIETNLISVLNACKEIEAYKDSFMLVFKYALAFSALMNKGRGAGVNKIDGTKGFKITEILKFADVKSNQTDRVRTEKNGKGVSKQKNVTLLDLLVSRLQTMPDYKAISFQHLGEAGNVVDLSSKHSLKTLADGIQNFETLIDTETDGDVLNTVALHLVAVKSKYLTLLTMSHDAIKAFTHVLILFNEIEPDEPLSSTPETFFTSLGEIVKCIQ